MQGTSLKRNIVVKFGFSIENIVFLTLRLLRKEFNQNNNAEHFQKF